MAENSRFPPLRPRVFPASPCYVCRSCKTVVGWHEHVLTNNNLSIIPEAILLSDVERANVALKSRPFVRGMYTLNTLVCGRCFNLLGWKIVASNGPISRMFAEGRFIFFARGIFFWDTRNLKDPVWTPSDIL